MAQDNAIYIVPVSLQEANNYLAEHIRQYQPMHGCKFSVGCALDGKLVGAVIVGRCRDDGQTLQIDRIYTTGAVPPTECSTVRQPGRRRLWGTGGSLPLCGQAGRIPPYVRRDGPAWRMAGNRPPIPCAMNGC